MAVTSKAADITIVGAGIVGLGTALQILRREPSLRVVVLDKEAAIGRHQTGHNSGVIHRGVYYEPGSLKARLCVRGATELLRFCDDHHIPYRLVGKLIIAAGEDELPALDRLEQRARANGVPGLRRLNADGIREIEPNAVGVGALHSPTTGIVDFGRVADAYAAEVRSAGGAIRLGARVTALRERGDHVDVVVGDGLLQSALVVTCAGLHSDQLAAMSGGAGAAQLKIVPFRGDYYVLRDGRTDLVRGLIYPVPDPRFPFLGVHFTPRMDGRVWLGPNAVLAFAREGYRRRDVSLTDLLATLRFIGFWRLARRYWRTGMAEMWRDVSRPAFARALRTYVPAIRDDDLVGHASGVRAQAVTSDGSLVDDFDVSGDGRLMHVRNAPSPAGTSSLAIGDWIAERAVSRLTR